MQSETLKVNSDINLKTRKEAARLLRVSVSTLDRWRMLGCGPIYRKLKGGVFYTTSDLEDFINAGKRISTGRAA